MKKLAIIFIALLGVSNTYGSVRLPVIFSNHMVLQRNQKVPIWGWSSPNEKVEVSFHHQKKITTADKQGYWKLSLDNENAGGPFQLIVKGENKIILEDVLIGEVWVCSGQSNMEFRVHEVKNATQEIDSANYPKIRHFKVANDMASTLKDDLKGGTWEIASPQAVGDFTAVGYFFALELYKKLHVPIGLINPSWGGTMAETWISREAFQSDDYFRSMISEMPKINLDSLNKINNKQKLEQLNQYKKKIEASDKIAQYKYLEFNDESWSEMELPNVWDSQLPDFDGTVWFRKEILISKEDFEDSITLSLSKIDDQDSTYINGILVGSTNDYTKDRKYLFSSRLLHEGKNVVAIKVNDFSGGGGVNGDKMQMYLSSDKKQINISGKWKFKVSDIFSTLQAIGPNSYPTLLYNAMINPLIPFAIKGVIWYQGESNTERSYEYRKTFTLLIKSWRDSWDEGDFPFYFVQLASFNANYGNSNSGSTWAELRESQTEALKLKNTGMSVTTDIGNAIDIHPKNKQDVGKRLSAIALNKTYKFNNEFRGPVFKNFNVEDNKVTVKYKNQNPELISNDSIIYGFEVAGEDQVFYPAEAQIINNEIIAYSEKVTKPVAIRYAWADNSLNSNLFNKSGFPAEPFRSDRWELKTLKSQYQVSE